MNESIDIGKLVRVYQKIRDARAVAKRDWEKEDELLQDKLAKVKKALLEYCKEHNVESVKTDSGLFYRTVRTNYWTSDWESMNKFILEHSVPELLEKRLHQGNMKEFLAANPDLLPPGLNVDSEYNITVRSK